MGKIWEFFDTMNEIVYVTDIDTHELVYMNKRTLAECKLESLEELKGKKCYEVLQKSQVPCAICNNHQISEGCFIEWQYYNPIKNRYFLIKDTMIIDEGRRLRLEIAVDNSRQEQKYRLFLEQQDQEVLANEGMRLALRAETPDKSIDIMLEYLGKALKGERTYIIEKNKYGGDDNTYEWVACGIKPEIKNLQNLPPEVCASWYRDFSEDKKIAIEDIEDIRETDPVKYELLKQQDVHSIVAVPLYDDRSVIGFYGVDNPHGKSLEYTENMLQIVGHFIISCLKRRNLLKQLEQMSYSDPLTQLGNRFGMDRYMAESNFGDTIGVVYCDITGLKKVNDSEGHLAGDRLILRASDCFSEVFGNYGLFRIGGDEILAICPGISKEELLKKTEQLRRVAEENQVVMALGAVWEDTAEDNIDRLLAAAEKQMYEDKSAYYKKMGWERRRV